MNLFDLFQRDVILSDEVINHIRRIARHEALKAIDEMKDSDARRFRAAHAIAQQQAIDAMPPTKPSKRKPRKEQP